MRAPPLPVCAALKQGSLDSPLIATNGDFPNYDDLPGLVTTGGDAGGWTAGVGEKNAVAPSDPNPAVRALLWHRIWHMEVDDFIGTETEEGTSLLFASTTNLSRRRYCVVYGEGVSPDFLQRKACDDVTLNKPPVRYPYCELAASQVLGLASARGVKRSV